MDALDLASRSFILLRAEWPAALARRRLANATASHAVIHRVDDPEHEYWYVFPVDELRTALEASNDDTSLAAAFALSESRAEAAVPASTPAATVPERAVVLLDGRMVGIVDRATMAAAEPPRPTRRGGARRGPATQPPPTTAARSLEADFPETVRVGEVGYLMAWIAVGGPTPQGLALAADPGEEIEVMVQPRRGFTLEGPEHQKLTVPESGEGLPARFELKAVDEGVGEIRVVAFHRGQAVGVIVLGPTVEKAPERVMRGRSPVRARTKKSAEMSAPAPVVPDLLVYIKQRELGGKVDYEILVNAIDAGLELNLRSFGPFELKLDPAEFFADFFKQIDDLPLDTPEQQAYAEKQLERKGAFLSERLLPPDLRQKLWEVRDRIKSIIIQSDEPWIPWELCRIIGTEDGRVVEDGFLCEKYTVTRWRPSIPLKRPLTLRNMALIVPSDSGLPMAQQERDLVLGLAAAKRKVTEVPATFEAVQDAFVEGVYDGWHFTGHGAATDENPDRSGMILEGDLPLTPEDVSGQAANVGVPRPLVFINACQIGRGGVGLTGIGGWANRFIEAGAAAFIGAYWSVYDEAAVKFAEALYERLTDGTSIGDAVRESRLAIRTKGDPTWLAYTVFADPLATVEA